MLGSEVYNLFSENKVPVIPLSRSDGFFAEDLGSVRSALGKLNLTERDLVVNCIGWIPQKSTLNLTADSKQAIFVNSVLPIELEEISTKLGFSILQILTDCVFSGKEAPYSEDSPQDAEDLYGLSKRLGETQLTRTMGVRCSIVGRTASGSASLLDWFLNQPPGSTVTGYENQLWNGVTTRAFARLCLGVFKSGAFESGKYHWVPNNFVSKFELLEMARNLSGRLDLTVVKGTAPKAKDLRLTSKHPERSLGLWKLAGYEQIPSISDLLDEQISLSSR